MTAFRGEVRFGVGGPGVPRSSVWKLWTSGDDVYIAARPIGSATKVSLHASGHWKLSFTSTFEAKEQRGGRWKRDSRHVREWFRPPPVRGRILAIRVFVATSELRPTMRISEKATIWVPSAPSNEAIEFLVAITSTLTGVGRLIGDATVLSELKLATLGTATLLARRQPVRENTTRLIEGARSRSIANAIRDGIDLSSGTIRAITWSPPEPDGSIVFYEIAIESGTPAS